MPGNLAPSPFATQLGSKFRGDWSLGELAYGNDFSAGVGTEFTGGSQHTLGTLGATPRPAYSNVLQVTSGQHSVLDTSLVRGVKRKTVTEISFWWSGENSWIDPPPKFYQGGVLKATVPTVSHDDVHGAWRHEVVSVSATNPVFDWYCDGYDSVNITGLQILITASPYMLGEFVLSNGKMWKSGVDNNSSTPGTGASWEEVAVNYNTSYATADRPSPVDAGKGATIYDSDLNLPLFSNGTAWTNAAGTGV